MIHYSVLGADGFIGSSLVRHLHAHGHRVDAVGRRDAMPERLGHAVFCVGVGAEFRERPFDTMDAHVSLLVQLLRGNRFESFTYLSSTRVYQGLPVDAIAHEQLSLYGNPNNPGDLYNFSKLAGESLCLSIDNPAIRVVRLSNVYGPEDRSDLFLTAVLRQVLTKGSATFFNGLTSAKDYISIADVLQALELCPVRASSRLINLARGRNVDNREIADLILRHTGCAVRVVPDGPVQQFPRIDVQRLNGELGVHPRDLADEFAQLVAGTRAALAAATP